MAGIRDKNAARTREALVSAGIELFTEHGFTGVSAVGLCHHLGVTRGAFYHHFPNMPALMEACFMRVDHALVEHVSASLGDGDPAEQLRRACDDFVDQLTQPTVRQILFIEAPAALGWARWRNLDGGGSLDLVRGLLRQARDAGQLGPRHDPDMLAHLLLGAVNELGMYVAASRSAPHARHAAHTELYALVDSMLTRPGRRLDADHSRC